MGKLFLLFIITVSLYGQLNVYTNLESSKKKFNSNNFIQISLAIVKELEKEANKNKKVHLQPLKKYNQGIKNAIFIGSPNEIVNQQFTLFKPLISQKYKLYGNRYEIYYIDSLEDAKSAKQIYCKQSQLTENMLKKNNFENLSYVKKSSTGLKRMVKSQERLWLNSDWEVNKYAKLAKLNTQELKPVLELQNNKKYLMFPKSMDLSTYEKYSNAYMTLKTNGTLNEIVQKWEKILNIKLELNDQGISVIE